MDWRQYRALQLAATKAKQEAPMQQLQQKPRRRVLSSGSSASGLSVSPRYTHTLRGLWFRTPPTTDRLRLPTRRRGVEASAVHHHTTLSRVQWLRVGWGDELNFNPACKTYISQRPTYGQLNMILNPFSQRVRPQGSCT